LRAEEGKRKTQRHKKSMALQRFSGAFPAGTSAAMQESFSQLFGDNWALCQDCKQFVFKDQYPNECNGCTPAKPFASINAQYIQQIVDEAAKEARAIAAAAASTSAPAAATATPNTNISTAINNLFTQHINSAVANEAAYWSSLNTANSTEAQMKQELHDCYITLNSSGAKTTWLNRVRNQANDQAKLDALMDLLNNP